VDQSNRILIVDDEPNVRLMLRTTLESVGYTVAEADDGNRALERVHIDTFDMILLDLLMPRMDGMELLKQLRAADISTPVVILTAHGSVPEAVAAMKLGAIDFLAKPITPDALRRVVADVVERHRLAAAAPDAPSPPVADTPATADHSKRLAFDLARAKRAINTGNFAEAERLLQEIIDVDPKRTEAHVLLDRVRTIRSENENEPFRILRNWFPSGGKARGKH
jgi:DNA-binding NtrC family response regulator